MKYFAVIAPAFHALYLEAMVKIFTDCSERTILKFEKLLQEEMLHRGKTIELDLEAEFSSLALDIIGLGVFNYDFGSVTKESPVIKVYSSILLWCCIHFTVHVNKLISSFLTDSEHLCWNTLDRKFSHFYFGLFLSLSLLKKSYSVNIQWTLIWQIWIVRCSDPLA